MPKNTVRKGGFPYNQLDSVQKQILLLTIIPDTNTDAETGFSIQPVPLQDQQPDYEALSYV